MGPLLFGVSKPKTCFKRGTESFIFFRAFKKRQLPNKNLCDHCVSYAVTCGTKKQPLKLCGTFEEACAARAAAVRARKRKEEKKPAAASGQPDMPPPPLKTFFKFFNRVWTVRALLKGAHFLRAPEIDSCALPWPTNVGFQMFF